MEFLNDMQLYFRGEKVESAVILLVSLALLLASIALIFWVSQPFTKGLGTVLLLAALIGVSVGGAVFFRTDSQVAELASVYTSSRQEFADVEGQRIDKVVASFRYYRFMYIVSGIVALALVSLTRSPALHGASVDCSSLRQWGSRSITTQKSEPCGTRRRFMPRQAQTKRVRGSTE